jgi:hypothetical protein
MGKLTILNGIITSASSYIESAMILMSSQEFSDLFNSKRIQSMGHQEAGESMGVGDGCTFFPTNHILMVYLYKMTG